MRTGRPSVPGRITTDDIKSAGMRRWDGRKRITTDWINLYHEPELCVPNGDCFVYLREQGQSSRGPSFRVQLALLKVKGFGILADQCTQQVQFVHEKPECLTNGCKGCGKPAAMRALYLPAPRNASLEATIDHHLSVRNFFAWLYNLPLAGRTLGKSLVELKDYLDKYRPAQEEQNLADIVTFADYQRYLDFRECVDHALAALHFAETCQIEGLWIDAFAHCVGMGHRGLRTSLEYPILSPTSKSMIAQARVEVDVRADRVSTSVLNFFENDLSAAFLGLHQAARDHLDRFRSFLQSFYIEQHGFWPPHNFEEEEVKKAIYSELYSDFRNLYHHLVDSDSTAAGVDNVSHSGGVCTLQNIQAFDARHGYESLPHPLPMLPIPSPLSTSSSTSKLASLSSGKKRRAQREARDEQEMKSLIDSSNRDWNIMGCLLVRRYSEFERLSILDDFEKISLVDGRKVRWILIYAVLQTLITVMQAPNQVRNTEGLSYSLSCHIPNTMPWNLSFSRSPDTQSLASSRTSEATASVGSLAREIKVELIPDVNYSHTNSSSASLSQVTRERRNSLPLLSTMNTTTTRTTINASRKASTASRSASLKRFLTKRVIPTDENPLPPMPILPKCTTGAKPPAFCEIFVQGYGNGLNDAVVVSASPTSNSTSTLTPNASSSPTISPISPTNDTLDDNVLVSRESSSASASSAYSARSTSSTNPTSGSNTDDSLPEMDHLSVSGEDSKKVLVSASASASKEKDTSRRSVFGSVRRARLSVRGADDLLYYNAATQQRRPQTTGLVSSEQNGPKEAHFTTKRWDAFLDV